MDEQPVALVIIILSPNNCVISFAYGVSPHPAHAPENSSNGFLNWLPFTVSLETTSSFTGIFEAISQFFICFS